jgi:serine/threonine-protein kinase
MTMTGTGLVVGTPGFIAPEVIVGGAADDPRSDLYALGVVWFEMLTGSKPFDAPTPFALALKHVQEPAPRVNAIRPFTPVPAPVEAAVVQLLEKSPERRPANADVLLKHLQALIYDADHPLEPATSTLRTAQDLLVDQKTETNFQSQPNLAIAPTQLTPANVTPPTVVIPRAKTTPVAAIAGAVVIVVLVIAVVVLALRSPATPVATPAPTPAPTGTPVAVPVAPPPVVATPTPPPVVVDAGPLEPVEPEPKVKKPKKPKLLLDP